MRQNIEIITITNDISVVQCVCSLAGDGEWCIVLSTMSHIETLNVAFLQQMIRLNVRLRKHRRIIHLLRKRIYAIYFVEIVPFLNENYISKQNIFRKYSRFRFILKLFLISSSSLLEMTI